MFLVEEIWSFHLLESDGLCVHSFASCAFFQKIYHYGLCRFCPKDEPDCQVHQKNFSKIFLKGFHCKIGNQIGNLSKY